MQPRPPSRGQNLLLNGEIKGWQTPEKESYSYRVRYTSHREKPFGHQVEGLSYFRHEGSVSEGEVQYKGSKEGTFLVVVALNQLSSKA
jgi:hypothetical protein